MLIYIDNYDKMNSITVTLEDNEGLFMNAENGKMFRSALSGYNKDDVNRYILETDRKYREEMDKLNRDVEDMGKINIGLADKNEKLEEKNAEITTRLAEMEAELAELKTEKKTLMESVQDLTKKNDFYKAQTEAQNEVLTKSREEKNVLAEKVEALTSESRNKDEQIRLNAEKYAADIETLRKAYEEEIRQIKDAAKADEGVAYKLDMYDKISSQIGDILINANRNSDDIITAARMESEKILLKANDEAERLRLECGAEAEKRRAESEENARRVQNGIAVSAGRVLDEIRDEFAGNMNNCVKEIQTCIADMQYETNALMALLQQKQEEMNERLEFYHVSVSDTVEGKLADLRSECAVMINGDPEAE